ncbi:MAG: putative enzyme related to lactoylglutathione lyase [Kiritimatiellia bacterium]|jgi:predicted enzyme related to lactoylglutathione lyase
MNESTYEPDQTPGIFGWNEFVTPETEAAGKFYKDVFGWEIEHMDMGKASFTRCLNSVSDRLPA